jgi:hypothetical protein
MTETVHFEVGDVWSDGFYTRTVLVVYERDVMVACEWPDGRQAFVLPKRLFSEGRCGQLEQAGNGVSLVPLGTAGDDRVPADQVTEARDKQILARNDPNEIERHWGRPLAICPDGHRCTRDAEWGHPCDRDERGDYECERLTAHEDGG